MSSDYQLEDTIFIPFTTRAFATGIPTVLAGTPAIDIYEDASTTQVVTGESLTVSLDTVAGFNMITVTATDATGFEAGKSYTAIIQAGTVDGVSVVGEVVGHFTLDMSAAAKDLANGTDGLGALKAEIAAVMRTDTVTLPGQETPTETPTIEEMLSYLYKMMLHRKLETKTEFRLFDAAGTVVDQKATVSDDGAEGIHGALESGP